MTELREPVAETETERNQSLPNFTPPSFIVRYS